SKKVKPSSLTIDKSPPPSNPQVHRFTDFRRLLEPVGQLHHLCWGEMEPFGEFGIGDVAAIAKNGIYAARNIPQVKHRWAARYRCKVHTLSKNNFPAEPILEQEDAQAEDGLTASPFRK